MELILNGTKEPIFEELKQMEWLETNGLGGWAAGTVAGAHTRRYQGLLVAATHPPVGRMVLLSKLDETIRNPFHQWELGTNQYPGSVNPHGFRYLKKFKRDLFPEFHYVMDNIHIRKIIAAVQGENTTLVLYNVMRTLKPLELELKPFLAFRDYHGTTHANQGISKDFTFKDDTFHSQLYEGSPSLYITMPGATFTSQPDWFYNFEYDIERERGLDYQEDLFTPGQFQVSLRQGDRLGIIISTENHSGQDAWELFHKEKERRESLIREASKKEELYSRLLLASDQFIVQRGEDLKSIIAGYPWFSDWGRDAMIALPGICLATGRTQDALKILKAFAEHLDMGMLPNRFPDFGEEPEYNTVDATLWFFIAVCRYYQQTSDIDSIQRHFWPALKDIIHWHDQGTRYQIRTGEDGLLYAGEPGVQLTWMDAKVGDWVVTPRIGAPVEVNALWYNALKICGSFAKLLGETTEAQKFEARAKKLKTSFQEMFWNQELGCLYDVINGDQKDPSIRPNQIFALSLPFSLFEGSKAQAILKTVEEKLYTPMGLRSLDPQNPQYQGIYQGGTWERDGAYHQGTVWSWLLGPYIDALIHVRGASGLPEASQVIERLRPHLDAAGIGTISEIFDGNAPHNPRGCFAQAWSVGELLRVCRDYHLANAPKGDTKREMVSV